MSVAFPTRSPAALRVGLFAIGACLCLAGLSPARADDRPAEPTAVSPLVVSASRRPTPANQVASSITVITAPEIAAKQARNLPDILRDVPGLNLVQTGGAGGSTSLFIRGANSNETKVLVDGIDVSDPTTPTGVFQFQNFMAAGVQQVEVLRGPQSGLYGSDAIGGVVEVITKAGSGPPHGALSLEGGSFGTFNQTGSVAGSQGPFSYALDLAHMKTDDSPVTPIDLLAPGQTRNNDRYENETVGTKLGYAVTPDFDVGLVARFARSDLHFTSDFDFGPGPDPVQSESRADQLSTRATAHLSLLGGRFDQTLGFAYTGYWRMDLVPNNAPSPNVGDRIKLDWQGEVKLAPGEVLVLGAEHQRDEIVNSPISASITNDAGFAELQTSLGGQFFNTVSVRYDSSDRYGGATTYRIAPSYLIAQTGTRLKASIGTGFKAPTLNELFVSYPAYFFFANPGLRPESSLGYDLGFEQTLVAGRLKFGVTYFHNDIKDLIAINDSFTTDVNIGRATTQGAETFIAWRPVEAFDLRVDYTYTDAKDDISHQQLLRRPRDKASVQVDWQANRRLTMTAEALYVGGWIDGNRAFTIPRMQAPGYVTVNLTAQVEVARGVVLFGRITNLLDRRYQDPIGFLQPRLGAFAGAKASF